MTTTSVERTINAPIQVVFDTVANIGQFSQAIPHIVNVEFLSETHSGVGTRFRETRLMKGKEATTELEVTEYVENERVRIVSDTHGTVWDTLFTVAEQEGATRLIMTMDANAYKLMPKLINPFIAGSIKKAIESDLDAVKVYCEDQD